MWHWFFAAYCAGVVAAAGGGLALWLHFERALEAPLAVGEESYRLSIEPGTPLAGIAGRLAADGVIAEPLYLRLAARLEGVGGRIQAGEYEIRPGMDMRDLLAMLVAGRVVRYRFTIVEGWTFAQLRRALARAPALEHTLAGVDDAELMARLDRPGVHPEGRFLPDTYFYTRGTTDLELLRRANRLLEDTLAALWAERAPDLPYADPHEALVMASIVEKETGVAAERAHIAGVLVRRLQRGMRLQTDPTVIYGLGPRFDGNLRRRDLERDSPYNTYRRAGLPPTPIALPGTDALRAVLDPAPGDALYFVARGDGTHHFSRTLEEHNRAVARYQLGASQ